MSTLSTEQIQAAIETLDGQRSRLDVERLRKAKDRMLITEQVKRIEEKIQELTGTITVLKRAQEMLEE